jgi:hypothetical protein
VPNINEVYNKLTPAKNVSKMMIANQSTNDIIKQVLAQHQENKIEAKKIAHMFDGGNLYATCENIWNFLKQNVPYQVEPSSKQSTKSLARILYDAKKGIGSDCKHYSSFIGSILHQLYGTKNWCFRFAGYSDYINVPTHVYVVAKDDEGDIFVDAVLSYFNVQKPFKLKVDKKAKDMSLYKLSGIDDYNSGIYDSQIGGFWDKIKKGVQKGFDVINKNVPLVKKIADVTGDVARKVKDSALTLGLAVPRNAFLLLIRGNVKGWATGLQNATFNDLVWWKDYFGGDRGQFMEAIKSGAKRKRILGIEENDVLNPSDLGFIGEPVTIVSALASASPILIKVSSFLDKAQKVADKVEGVTSKINDTATTIKNAQAKFEQSTGIPLSNLIFKKQEGQTGAKNSLDASDFSTPTDAEAKQVASAFAKAGAKSSGLKQGFKIDNKFLLIGGGIAAAGLIYFATKRK